MRVLFWGTYDQDRPRNRISINSLRSQSLEVIECHGDAWQGVTDKSTITGFSKRFRQFFRLGYTYLGLVYRYLRQPDHDVVVVGYLGLIDVFVIWPWARLRRKPIVWDALMSIHTTLVVDRKIVKRGGLLAKTLFAAEWLACRLVDGVLVTTGQRRDDLVSRYGLPSDRVTAIPVGVEYNIFPERPSFPSDTESADKVRLLFYGNFLPLHGVETIVKAAQLSVGRPYHWTLIGSGQTAVKVRDMLERVPVPLLTWIPRVAYTELSQWIHRADIGLGIFGGSEKAKETIPNKIYQILATGTPLISRDSPAMREIIPEQGSEGIYLVPPDDPRAILDAISKFEAERHGFVGERLHQEINAQVRNEISGKLLKDTLCTAIARRQES